MPKFFLKKCCACFLCNGRRDLLAVFGKWHIFCHVGLWEMDDFENYKSTQIVQNTKLA